MSEKMKNGGGLIHAYLLDGTGVADLEDQVLDANSSSLRFDLAELRRQTISLRRYLAPQRDAFAKLISEKISWLDDDSRLRLREVSDRLIRHIEDLVAAEKLEVKIAEVEAATDLPETTKTKLTELYRETLDQRFPATRYPPRYQQIPQGTGGAGSGACYGWWNRAASGLTEVIITPLPHNKAVNAISVKSTGQENADQSNGSRNSAKPRGATYCRTSLPSLLIVRSSPLPG